MAHTGCCDIRQEPGFYPRPRHELDCPNCGLTMRVAAVDEKDHEGNILIAPRAGHGPFVPFCCHGNQWRITDNPAVRGHMVHGDTALRQNLFQITVGNAIPDSEENRVQDNVFRIVVTFKADIHFLATKMLGSSE